MCNQIRTGSHQNLLAVSFSDIIIEDEFWSSRLSAHKKNTLKACLDKCESTGRISNFAKAGKLLDGEFEGTYYNDFDLFFYKFTIFCRSMGDMVYKHGVTKQSIDTYIFITNRQSIVLAF